jgi:hypothetical protein
MFQRVKKGKWDEISCRLFVKATYKRAIISLAAKKLKYKAGSEVKSKFRTGAMITCSVLGFRKKERISGVGKAGL